MVEATFSYFPVHQFIMNWTVILFHRTQVKAQKRKRIKGQKKEGGGGGSCKMINLEEPSLSYNFFILRAAEWQRWESCSCSLVGWWCLNKCEMRGQIVSGAEGISQKFGQRAQRAPWDTSWTAEGFNLRLGGGGATLSLGSTPAVRVAGRRDAKLCWCAAAGSGWQCRR